MSRIAFDTETWLILRGRLAPRMVCGSFYDPDPPAGTEGNPSLTLREEALDALEWTLTQDPYESHIVIQNAAFDMGVVANERPHLLAKIIAAYDAGRIRCTKTRERLIAIARGELKDDDHPGKKVSFALDALVKKRFNVDISGDKKDPNAWRLRYHELDGVPLDQWPAEAVRYAKDDAVWHMKVFEDQARECGLADDIEGYFPNEREQTRRAFALHLMGMWGPRTDPKAVQALADRISASVDEARKVLAMDAVNAHSYMQAAVAFPDQHPQFAKVLTDAFEGVEVDWRVPEGPAAEPIIRLTEVRDRTTKQIRIDETENQKVLRALVEHAYGVLGRAPPRTPPSERHPQGQVQFSGEVLEATRDPRLLLKAHIGNDEKIKSVWLDTLWEGTTVPITARWESPLATGRTSCAQPPLQQPMRKGGVRECFVPRPGFWYLATDYSFIELCAWAQACLDLFGYSDLAEAIRAGKDPHCVMGAEILRAEGGEHAGVTYEELRAAVKRGEVWAKDARQLAKAANFGYPGGLQAKTFIAYAWANYGVRLDLRKAELVRGAWLATYREAQPYLDYHKGLAPQWGDTFTVVQARSERVRGGCTYTSGCNCVDYETEALTKRGWVNGADLRMDDEILTKNAATGALEWQFPQDISHFPDYTGPLVEFSSTRFSAVTTPNHRWLVTDHKSGESKCVVSEKLSRNGDHRIHRTGRFDGPDGPYSDDFLELAGWMVTDGSYDRESLRVRIYQKKPGTSARIEALLRRMSLRYSYAEQTNTRANVWSLLVGREDNATRRAVQGLRNLFPERLLTVEFVATLSRRQAQHLLDVLVLGDGSRQNTAAHICTRSESAASAMQMLATLAGMASRIEHRDMSTIVQKKYDSMPNIPRMTSIWIVRLYRRDTVQVQKHQARDFVGDRGVWCPSVPNTYFVARRKGTVYVTGNTRFQGLAADGAEEAHWRILKECYLQEGEPLFGCRPVLFLHDEFILEVPADPDLAHAANLRLMKHMIEGMQVFIPDVPIKAEPSLMDRWYKSAEPVYDEKGRLTLWHPKEV